MKLAEFKEKYIGDRAFYKRYLYLALPMIVQNAITNLVSFLDNIMVGQLGTEQMSGVAIVNQLIFVYNLAIFGAVSAASIFGAQYYGKRNHKGHMYSFRFKLYAALLVTGLTILLLTCGDNLISLYLTDTAGDGATDVALGYGLQYLGIMVVGLVPFAVNQAYATNIKETGQTMVPMVASFVAVGSNALLDYLLIFGIGPFPELGVAGAALATVIARYIEAFIIIVWAHSHTGQNLYLKGAYTGFGIPGEELKAIIVKGFPLMLNEVLWAAGMTAVTQCYSVRGLEVVAGLNSDDNHKPVQHHLSAAWFLHQYRGRTVSGRRRAGRSKGRRQQDDRVQCVLLRDRGRSYAGGRRIFPADLQYNGGDQGACDKLHRRIGDDHAVLFVQPCVVLYAAIGRKNDGYVPV